MEATADTISFTPPPEPAAVRGFVLAVIAHLLLLVALSLGINWDKDTPATAVEAELWSAVPQEAAPTPPPPQPEVQAPPVVQPPPAPPVVAKAPDINLEREKQRREEQRREEQARLREEELHRKQAEAQKRKLEEQQRLADEKKQKDELARKDKQKKELEAKKLEQLRRDQIARMQALAAGAGSPDARGTAAKSSGPSADYAGRIAALIKRHTRFVEALPNNPSVEVEIRVAPDGTIVGDPKVVKSSGNAARDEAVVRGIIATERLPRDRDGRIPPAMIVSVRQFD